VSRATPAADAAPDAVTPDAPRVLIADARAAARSVLEPLLRRDGLEVCAVASSFDVLRTLRDQPVSLILIDPELPGGGVSGVDVVRTLKGSTRFRRLPALFLLAGPQPVPAGLGVLARGPDDHRVPLGLDPPGLEAGHRAACLGGRRLA